MSVSEERESEERINIMTLGNSEVGKTSFILKYTENSFQDIYLATVGIDFKIKNITLKEKQYKLFFYDTTGQEKYKSIALNIIKNAHGIILMYDINKKTSFESIPEWIKSAKDAKGDNFPMILLGNKIDIENEREVTKEEGEALAKENNLDFYETSNKTGINIEEAGLAIVNKILEKRQRDTLDYSNTSSRSSQLREDTRSLNEGESKKCCGS